MPTHRRRLTEVSGSELAELTSRSYRWLHARLARLEPVRVDGRTRWYSAPEALRRIYVDEEHLDLSQERAHLAKVQRELAALKLAVARGELVQADRVARGWARVGLRVRDAFLRVPARLAPVLAMQAQARCYEALDREIREVLNLLAEQGYKLRAAGGEDDLEGDAA